MKTKFKYFAMAIVALLMVVGFSSCSSDDTPQIDTEETKTVFLKISNGQPDTRAEGPAVEGGATVAFTKGHIYFTNGDGKILRYHSIASTGADFTVDELTGGKNITNLPSTVTQVYIVGNTTDLTSVSSISEVKNQTLKVKSQGTIGNVNLYGACTNFEAVNGKAGNFTAALTLAPTVSRIELAGITGSGRIESFEVDGIFIDNYYSTAQVDGTVSFLVSHDSEPKKFSGDKEYGKYGIETNEASSSNIYDWYTTPKPAGSSTNSLIATPTSGVWGYNLFAASDAKVPRIIIRLSNIIVTGGVTFTDPQFITVKGFKNAEGDAAINAFEAGNIYKIAAKDMVFDETNLTPQPNMATIDVEVTVKVATWNAVGIKPIL